jgi:hypothetical protein
MNDGFKKPFAETEMVKATRNKLNEPTLQQDGATGPLRNRSHFSE